MANTNGLRWTITDGNGDPVDLSGKDVFLVSFDDSPCRRRYCVVDVTYATIKATNPTTIVRCDVAESHNNHVAISVEQCNPADDAFRYAIVNRTDCTVLATGFIYGYTPLNSDPDIAL